MHDVDTADHHPTADIWQHSAYESQCAPRGLQGRPLIWLVDPERPGPYGDAQLLSEAERDRAARMLRVGMRRQYVAAHALLRVKLSEQLGIAPALIQFRTGRHGKPELARNCGLHFSVSHTHGLVGCAISHGVPIGLDLERIRPLDAVALSPAVLDSAEQADVAAKRGQQRWQRFLQYWTLKEATLKLHGVGMLVAPTEIAVAWPPDTGPRLTRTPDQLPACHHQLRHWQLHRASKGPSKIKSILLGPLPPAEWVASSVRQESLARRQGGAMT